MTVPVNFWFSGWATNHAAAGDNGFIQGWDLVNQPNLMAQKNISQSITMQGVTLTEKTDLKLKPFNRARERAEWSVTAHHSARSRARFIRSAPRPWWHPSAD